MSSASKFLRDERGNVFGNIGMVAVAAVLFSWAYIALSNPNLSQIVESVTVGQVLAIAPDGYAEGIAMPEKPAKIVFIGDKQ